MSGSISASMRRRSQSDAGSQSRPLERGTKRVALITNFCPHYRLPLFQELSSRMNLDLILTSRGKEWYWQGERPSDAGGLRIVSASGPVKLRRELRAGAYDAVVASLTGRATLLVAVHAARSLNLPLVLWVGIWEQPRTLAHRVSRPFAQKLYRSADAIVTYGAHVSDFVVRESGRTRGVFIAPQAVNNEFFRAKIPPLRVAALRERLQVESRPIVTFAGRLEDDKGIDYLLEASAKVDVSHGLVIAGTGPSSSRLRAKAVSLGIEQWVRWVGHLSQAELADLLHASDVLVLPSVATKRWREPWGLVINEAMNCNLPVIATDAVGAVAGGLVVHEATGLVVPERDSHALARALDVLLRDPSRRERLGESASTHVLQWNYHSAADVFMSALNAAAENRASACVS
jgi:glycosyltransferase involved in cell wall biosynthesis